MAVTPTGPELPTQRRAPGAEVVALPSARLAAGPLEPAHELTTATRAVLDVAAALARYAVTSRSRAPLAAARRLAPSRRRLVAGAVGLGARVVGSTGRLVVDVTGALADVVLPTVAREALSRVDVTGLVLEFVDLNRIAAALDVDAVVATVDLDAVVDRIDVAGIAAGLDLDALVERVDVARVIDRVDLDEVVAKVDLDRAVDRVDIDRVLGRVDLDEVVATVDLDRAVDRVDIDRVIARADVVALARWVVQEIDLPTLIRSSTGSVATEMVRGVRDQSTDADRAVERAVDRLLHRRRRAPGDAAGKGAAVDASQEGRRDRD